LQANEIRSGQSVATRILRIATEAAYAAAQVINAAAPRLRSLEWVEKGAADFVTEVDKAAEARIADVVHAGFPDALIVGEELSPDDSFGAGALAFIVDPLDGTTNFLHAFPHYAVSIGVMHENELTAAVILNVPRGDLFTAIAGGGAQLNGSNVRVSSIDSTSRSLIGTGFPFKNPEMLDEYARQFVEVSRHTAGIRRPGSAALDLADVACGRFEGFWELTLAPWDVAAGILLVREAGGIVTDLRGSPAVAGHGAIVAGNSFIHPWLLRTLQALSNS